MKTNDKPLPQDVRRHLYKNPGEANSHWHVGAIVYTELHRRIHGNNFGRIPRALGDDAFSMAGYCIDAPSGLPGGSVRYDRFGPEPESWIISQSIVWREDQ